MIVHSLRRRLLLGAMAAILAALAVAWLLMTLLFGRHLERRLHAEMSRDALALVAGLSIGADGRPALREVSGDRRWSEPASGSYWQVSTPSGVLRSRSLWDAILPRPAHPPIDDWQMRRIEGPFDEPLSVLERSLQLRSDGPAALLQLAQDARPLADARAEFGRELGLFLALLWLVLSAAAWLQVRLGLHPLGRVRADLVDLQSSARARLPTASVAEIQPLTDAINALAQAREDDLERARRRAADLAHALKTPLSALAAQSRRSRAAGAAIAADGMDRAIAAVNATIESELARARIDRAGHGQRGECHVRPVLERLIAVLEHTEAGERVVFVVDVPDSLALPLAAEDLSEILGAMLENAARYAARQVCVGAWTVAGRIGLSIDDDGPGLNVDERAQAVERGVRLDESGGGTGLGLAIARDLVQATGGELRLFTSTLGGLEVRLTWPTQ